MMSARERLEARRRIEWLLDEGRRRVAPPPEKATTPVGWLDRERRRCSLEGAATTSSFGSVDDEAAINDRATQTDLRSEKKKQQQQTNLGYILGCPETAPSLLPYLLPLVKDRGKKIKR